MNLKDIAPLLPWIVGLILGLVYRKDIKTLSNRIGKAKLTRDAIEIETREQIGKISFSSEESTNILKDIKQLIEDIRRPERPYASCHKAFEDARECIKQSLLENDDARIDIKIIAVAMVFSWPFVRDELTAILENYPNACANVELAFVDCQHLQSLSLKNVGIDWVGESKKRITDISNTKKNWPKSLGDRISVTARVYKNIPHWHGILVNNGFLFMGRTGWSFDKDDQDRPIITVGQNKYRYFDNSSSSGEERIELFRNWHRYYLLTGVDPQLQEKSYSTL